MTDLLISIKPNYVSQILNETKKFEYRRRKPKRSIDKIYIYETRPTKMVVGYAEVLEVIEKDVPSLWKETSTFSGMLEEDYLDYFNDKEKAIAFKLGKVTKFKNPKTILEVSGKTMPPQQYYYI